MKFFVLLISTLFTNILSAQTPFYNNYSPEEYSASTQNWAILQDHRGVMYFGNNDGILEYDGTNWRLIKTKATVRSLALSEDGTIYFGTVNNFGRLVPDDKGFLQLQSLKDKIPTGKENCKDVWRTRIIGNEVFFCSFEKIFRWKDEQISVYEPEQRFTFSFKIRGELFVHEQGQGLMYYNGSDFELLPNTEAFVEDRIFVLLPYGEDQLLIGTQTNGISIYSMSEQKILPQPNEKFAEVNDFLIKWKVYSGIELPDGNIAMGTVTFGMIIFTPQGKIIGYYNKTNGLQDNSVFMLELDDAGLLWATLNHGISTINLKLPFTAYTEQDGLNGTIFSLEKFQNELYIGTSQKMYRLTEDESIEDITNTKMQNWFLKAARGKLLLAHNPNGFLQIDGDQALSIAGNDNMVGVAFCELEDQPDYLIGGAHEGFFLLHFLNGNWRIKHNIKGFNNAVYGFDMDRYGNLWVRGSPNDLYKVRLNESLDSIASLEKMTTAAYNLEIGTVTPHRMNNGEIIFSSDNGVYQYSETNNQFSKYPVMEILTGEISPIMQDSKGNIWYEESKGGQHIKGVFKKKNEKDWVHERTPFYKFSSTEIYKGPTATILEDDEGKIVFGTTKGLLKYDPDKVVNYDQSFNTEIRRIYVNDTLFSSGYTSESSKLPIFSYEENNFRFDYTALYYEDSDRIQYRYRLLGRDTTWSDLTSNTSKEYTNLREGRYSFEVKAFNIYKKESKNSIYSFKILPPWHRTLWAYIIYALGAVFLIVGIVRINSARLRKTNHELEKMITERTSELRVEKDKSEQLSHNLLRIFAIVGHDLRRPVLAFRGITKKINYLLQIKDFERLEQLGSSIEHEAQSLHQLTDNLLNWALMQRDVLPHEPASLPLRETVESVFNLFAKVAKSKNIILSTDIADDVTVLADSNALHTIMRNLVDNALKFTPEDGQVEITAQREGRHLNINVKDTGIGMPADKVRDIFLLQKEKSQRGTQGEKGTGLGLHLVYELVKINKGIIKVSSQLGQGTSFNVLLPTLSTS